MRLSNCEWLKLAYFEWIAVIGPNAKIAAYCGGGSASLKPYYAITPYEGIAAQAKVVKYSIGCSGHKKPPVLSRMTKTEDGRKGITMRVYLEPASDVGRNPIDTIYLDHTEIFFMDYQHSKLKSTTWYTETEGLLTPEESGEYIFSLSVAGTALLYIDGKLVVDNENDQTPGDSFFGSGTDEKTGIIDLEAGKTYTVIVKHGTLPTSALCIPGATAMGAGGLRIGGIKKIDEKEELEKAVELAKSVDQVVICAGLNSEWESEGYDRTTMSLPGLSTQLINTICSTNPNTAVILQSGTPTTISPYLTHCPALLQAWYGGNETGNAIADVLFGDVNPSGKLPLTFPIRNEDNPAFLNYRSEAGKVVYGEGVFVGYRFYEKIGREVAFPFGHGLSYTSFTFQNLQVTEQLQANERVTPNSSSSSSSSSEIIVTVSVSNTGSRPGAQVVQVYIAPPSTSSVNRPVKELKGFAKVQLAAGETKEVIVRLERKYAVSFWDERRDCWRAEGGRFEVLVGGSCVEAEEGVDGEGDRNGEKDKSLGKGVRGVFFGVRETRWWKGL